MLKWFQTYPSDKVSYHQKYRVTKDVYGRKMSKVKTGFVGIRLKRYQVLDGNENSNVEEKEVKKAPFKVDYIEEFTREHIHHNESDNEGEGMNDEEWVRIQEEAEREMKKRRLNGD